MFHDLIICLSYECILVSLNLKPKIIKWWRIESNLLFIFFQNKNGFVIFYFLLSLHASSTQRFSQSQFMICCRCPTGPMPALAYNSSLHKLPVVFLLIYILLDYNLLGMTFLHGRSGMKGFSSLKRIKISLSRGARFARSPLRGQFFYPLSGRKNLSCPPAHVGKRHIIT